MKIINVNKFFLSATIYIFVFQPALAENIIQTEKVSYEKCLDILEESKLKLSKKPTISSKNQKLIADFEMVDGILSITCDKKLGELTVSSKDK